MKETFNMVLPLGTYHVKCYEYLLLREEAGRVKNKEG